jgi:putative tricarboxylic transport membrane protein
MQASGVPERVVEITVAVFMFVIGAVMMIDNYHLGAGWAKDGPQSGYFPFRIGAIICLASVAVLLQVLLRSKRRNAVFVTYPQLKLVLYVLVPTLVYVAAIQFAGIYLASAVFIAAFMRIMDKYSWLKTLAVSVGLNAILFWLFEVQFLVPLPKGPLEALFGY